MRSSAPPPTTTRAVTGSPGWNSVRSMDSSTVVSLSKRLTPAQGSQYCGVSSMTASTTAYATCPLCEATCGLELTLANGDGVARIRGDAEDVFSHGFICPKGATLKALHEDPDRLRTPLVRRDGELVEATGDEAFEEIARRLPPIIAEHGPNSV